jgi:hypothetical protein
MKDLYLPVAWLKVAVLTYIAFYIQKTINLTLVIL